MENAFLPKELAEVIATRQRRERAWHVRVMICTTVLSNIDSTLASLTEGIEKEETESFKAYLRVAISNFAAAESAMEKENEKEKEKETVNNLPKKVAIATPRIILSQATDRGINKEAKLPITPLSGDNSWAAIARNGQKKARVTLNNNAQAASWKATQSLSSKHKPTKAALTDKRLFVRLPLEHEWRKLSPSGIREVIVNKLAISPSLLGKIKPVKSGFALSPCSTEARENILNAGNGLFLTGAKLEPATNWIPVILPTVPSSIRKVQGQMEVSSAMLIEEVERVTSILPAHVKLFGRNKAETPHRTWMAYFSKAPRTGFRVFDESGIARPFKKQQPIEFCKRCNGHHPTKNCSSAPSCGNCGSTNHSEELCMAATKCRNCGGPHRSDSRRCLARPIRLGAPTKEQMKTFRQVGEREYQAVLRAKAAEESANSAENINIDLTCSQDPEVDGDIDNIPATHIENSTDVLLIQEPWWSNRTKTHPYYDLYLPFGGENVRSRAATFIRKDPKRITSSQKYPPSPTGDYCWVEVNDVMFLNVYKAPHDLTAVQPLLNWTPPPRSVAIGDFNSVYWAWQPGANRYYGQGEEIEK
ncbi:putative eka-like protein [Erysiphe necator]|uniref:Putative eka-like protein n=1 Tax=Uncinula necator TaxID=52586 RepID=A0A0B1NXX9_UNCNE|nr:putative eka-like protein [Erysiphe necator]